MAFQNPSDSSEIFYGASGDVRDEINSYAAATTAGHYADEMEIPGSLIINSIRKATRLIDTFLEPVYAEKIPFGAAGDVPKILDEIGSDMATYFVLRSSTAKLGAISEDKRKDYYSQYTDPENGLLSRIAKKEIQIPELTAVSPADAKSLNTDYHPIFDMDDEDSQIVNPDLLDDIKNSRDT